MKRLSLFIAGSLAALSIYAQQNISALTITVNGNKNLQISVDGRNYSLDNSTAIGNKTTISLNNLEAGQHTFLATRTKQNINQQDRTSATFNLRYGYDMLLKVNGNGSLELIETIKRANSANLVPVSDAVFNNLLKSVNNQRSVTERRTIIATAFNKSNNYFTSSQIIQLLRPVNSESFRLQLAKLAYPVTTDHSNFYQVYNLLNSQASRNSLEDFLNSYTEDSNLYIAMSDAGFNSLHHSIQQQWPVSTQMNSLTNAFNDANNYFTTFQAKQLIQLISAESNRLQLAKLSYRSIVDRGNFNQLYDLLNSQASINELRVYVNNYNTGSSSNVAMSDINFNSLHQSIQQQWPVSNQVNSLTNAFNNSNNYFTTAQAKQLIQIVIAESSRLHLAKSSYRSITDPVNFSQVYNLLNSQASINELVAYVNNYNTGANPTLAMSDANFNSLHQNIQQQWPVSNQVNSLTNAFINTNNYFTTYQARQLIQIVSAESSRLQLAKSSYRSITDPVNFNQVYNLLNSQASINELVAYVNNYNIGTTPNPAMSDANFNTLFQTIEKQYFPFEQMNSLTNVFNNSSNYFTSAQAKQLIPLVSSESNRLQLAKLSYRTITDRGNFNQLYDLLNSEANRNELDAYVKAYKN